MMSRVVVPVVAGSSPVRHPLECPLPEWALALRTATARDWEPLVATRMATPIRRCGVVQGRRYHRFHGGTACRYLPRQDSHRWDVSLRWPTRRARKSGEYIDRSDGFSPRLRPRRCRRGLRSQAGYFRHTPRPSRHTSPLLRHHPHSRVAGAATNFSPAAHGRGPSRGWRSSRLIPTPLSAGGGSLRPSRRVVQHD